MTTNPPWGYRAPASGLAPSGAQYTFYGASNVATPNPAMWQPGMMPPSGSFLAEKCEESGGCFFWEWIAGCFTKEKTDKLICLAPERSVILAIFAPNKTSHELTVYLWIMFSVRLLAALGHSVIHVHRYGYTKKNMLCTSPDLMAPIPSPDYKPSLHGTRRGINLPLNPGFVWEMVTYLGKLW